MNILKSTEFNAGALYSSIVSFLYEFNENYYRYGRTEYTSYYSIPKFQIFPDCITESATKEIVDVIERNVSEHFNACAKGRCTLTFNDCVLTNDSCVFNYTIKRIEEVKEMTVADIEKKLGHKIKVVGE